MRPNTTFLQTLFTRIALVALAAAVTPSLVSGAQSEGLLNKLFAPGPLMEGHKDLEKSDCLKCHDAGQGVPDAKCLDCHKEVRKQVQQKTSFHGMQSSSCLSCHSDHKGRAFESTIVDSKTFDHAKTGYALEGKHAELKCTDCHTEKRTEKVTRKGDIRFFGKADTCNACHRKHDVHFFKGPWVDKQCSACHGMKSWKTGVKFDHARDTKYKLVGHHASMKCSECHTVDKEKKLTRYEWPTLEKTQCLACHEDVHKNNLGAKFRGGDCTQCHAQTDWKIPSFDHAITGYKLRGRHAELRCTECHKQNSDALAKGPKQFKWTGLGQQCLSCHKDHHHFGPKPSKTLGSLNNCSQCHTERDWKTTHDFSHSGDTRFPLTGKHVEAAMSSKCLRCHIPEEKNGTFKPVAVGTYQWPELAKKDCETCHESPHTRQFSKEFLAKRCTECHSTDGWKLSIKKADKNFNHSSTRFELTGAHLRPDGSPISCNKCHLKNDKQVFRFPSFAQQFCVDCHQNQHLDQFHTNLSSKSCTECHGTTSFSKLKPFDHDQTAFALRGGHATLKCTDCHTATDKAFATTPAKVKHQFLLPDLKAKSCMACHSDYHKGQLPSDCTKCHNEQSWKKASFDHNRDSVFKLTGEHARLKCDECHKPRKGDFTIYEGKRVPVTHFKPLSMKCADCHKDSHKGNFGARCEECHVESGWKKTKDFHKNFNLSGVHYLLECSECHRSGARLSGLSNQCQACHQRDDVHSGTLPNCGDCHRQQFWEVPNFRHSLTRFPLRGVHRTLDCFECHSRGIYAGTPTNCIDCHRSDAQAVTSPSHSAAAFTSCAQCHNQFSFR